MAKQRIPKGLGNYRKLKDGRVAWRQTIDGQTREISAKSIKDLKLKVRDIADTPIIKEKMSVENWFDRWLEVYVEPLRKESTYNHYKGIYNTHIKPVIGKLKLVNVKTYDIQSVISKMNKKEKSTKTMTHAKSIMDIAFKKAVKEKLLGTNPVIDIEIPEKQPRPRKTLTVEELSILFTALAHSRWIWSVKFDLVTGLRRGELLPLLWTDIDWEGSRVCISKSLGVTGLGDTKSSKIRYSPLSEKAIEYLHGQMAMLKKELNLAVLKNDGRLKSDKEILKSSSLIFPGEHGHTIRADSYYTMLSRFAKRAGINASPHCLRHTFVYYMRSDLTLKELQAILGHAQSTTTLDIYGDMIYDAAVKNAAQINAVFSDLETTIIEKQETRAREKELEKKQNNVVHLNTKKEAI